MNNFENLDSHATSEYAFQGKFSNEVEPQGFSCTYEIQMDSLWSMVPDSCDICIKASCRFLNTGLSQLVVSIEGNENYFYDYSKFGKTGMYCWGRADLNRRISRYYFPKGFLKVYVWNNGSYPTYVDDLRVAFVVADDFGQ